MFSSEQPVYQETNQAFDALTRKESSGLYKQVGSRGMQLYPAEICGRKAYLHMYVFSLDFRLEIL